MHAAARDYVRTCLDVLPLRAKILEIGSRDINGGIRDLLPKECDYLGIDIRGGPGVDIVADGATFRPDYGREFDTVICCEVLEHTPAAREIVHNALELLAPGGFLIVTCAGPGRNPHSAEDGEALRDGEFYGNIELKELREWLAGFEWHAVHQRGADVQALAMKGWRTTMNDILEQVARYAESIEDDPYCCEIVARNIAHEARGKKLP